MVRTSIYLGEARGSLLASMRAPRGRGRRQDLVCGSPCFKTSPRPFASRRRRFYSEKPKAA